MSFYDKKNKIKYRLFILLDIYFLFDNLTHHSPNNPQPKMLETTPKTMAQATNFLLFLLVAGISLKTIFDLYSKINQENKPTQLPPSEPDMTKLTATLPKAPTDFSLIFSFPTSVQTLEALEKNGKNKQNIKKS